nr:uncharacterized protein LOC118878714 [Drosophila suzukii]
MCRGPNPGLSPAINSHYAIQHDSVHNFPSVPAFEVGSTPQQAVSEDHIQQEQPAGSTSYQKKPHHPPLPQQQQPHAHYRFYGNHLAAPSSAPSAPSYGLPTFSQPIVDSPPAASPGISTGPGAAATTHSHSSAEPTRSSNHPNNKEMVGHQFNCKSDVLAVPTLRFQQDELNQELCRPENQPYPEDQLMWVSLSHTQGPENDPVMKAFYRSFTSAEAMAPADNKPASVPLEPISKMASGYSAFDSQYPGASARETLSSPPSTYSQVKLSPAPNQHCSGHSASVPPFQCLTQRNVGLSLKTSCPNFQPVIITMPCYGQRQPTPYVAMPRTPPGTVRSQTKAIPFGLDKGPVVSPFGGGFGLGTQFGSLFGMNPQTGTQEYDMEHQVGGPFGIGRQFGMGLNPFGPFGATNPFNPFNRILGAPASNVPAPNLFQQVLKFKQSDEISSTTEAAPHSKAYTERSEKLNYSNSTPTPFTSEHPNPVFGTHQESSEDEDSHEDKKAVTTSIPASEAVDSAPEISDILSKAASLLKPDKRKRLNNRSIGRVSQSHKYLQQL